jgi:hypothetical protein
MKNMSKHSYGYVAPSYPRHFTPPKEIQCPPAKMFRDDAELSWWKRQKTGTQRYLNASKYSLDYVISGLKGMCRGFDFRIESMDDMPLKKQLKNEVKLFYENVGDWILAMKESKVKDYTKEALLTYILVESKWDASQITANSLLCRLRLYNLLFKLYQNRTLPSSADPQTYENALFQWQILRRKTLENLLKAKHIPLAFEVCKNASFL